MVLFEIFGYGDTSLTPVLYIIQSVWCVLVPIPFFFILGCWKRFPWTRNVRTFFTLYLSGIDSASRLIFLHYFLLRLITIYSKGLWLDDERGLVRQPCDSSNSTANFLSVDPCRGENVIGVENCLVFSLFLYWASTWPMTSIFLLQIHALVASIVPEKYEKRVTSRFAFLTMCLVFAIDLILGAVSFAELKSTIADEPSMADGCKFEYFSRLSVINSSYVFALTCLIGLIALAQLVLACVNNRRKRKFVNAAANNPFHGWAKMPLRERILTASIMAAGILSFILFIIHFIVYLIEGNSTLRQILNITISVFSFVGPIELMWFNIDIRKSIFILIFRQKNEQSITSQDESKDESKNPTESSSLRNESDNETDRVITANDKK